MAQQTDADEPTRMDEVTLEEAIEWVTEIPTAELHTQTKVWATIHSDVDKVQGVVASALKAKGVVVHKVERQEGFVSIALEDYADDL